MKRIHPHSRVAVLCSGLLALSFLGACSADDPTPSESPSVEQGAQGTATPGAPADSFAPALVDITDQPGAEDFVGASNDASVTSCESRDGQLYVSGTVTNGQAAAQTYRIYVSAMQGEETRGLVQVDVDAVGGQETREWATEVALPDEDLACLLRVERQPTR